MTNSLSPLSCQKIDRLLAGKFLLMTATPLLLAMSIMTTMAAVHADDGTANKIQSNIQKSESVATISSNKGRHRDFSRDFSAKVLPEGIVCLTDLYYTKARSRFQALDLYLPADYQSRTKPIPLIVFIHGGGWFMGDKDQSHYMLHGVRYAILSSGYALASINYRLSGSDPFPAQIQDCKSAVRWLRAHAEKYRIDSNRFGLWGGSAGGNLAALFGTSFGEKLFETGEYLDQSTQVQAVADFCGKTDLLLIADDPHPEKIALYRETNQYLGGPIRERREIAKAASPVTWVSPDDPPFLIVHGNVDTTNDYRHALRLNEKLQAVGVEVTLHTLTGTSHDGPAFVSSETLNILLDFFDRHLRPDLKE